MASISNTLVFHYGGDPDLFFFKFDAYIKSTKKDSAEALYVDNKTARWIMGQSEDTLKDKDTLVKAFKAKFCHG